MCVKKKEGKRMKNWGKTCEKKTQETEDGKKHEKKAKGWLEREKKMK
jgi:hypothetical protein